MKAVFRFMSAALAVILALGMTGLSVSHAGPEDGKLRVMVQFAPGSRGGIESALQTAGAEFHYAFNELNTFVVSVPAAALGGLTSNPNVLLVEEDARRYPISIMPSAAPSPALAGAQTVPYGIDMVQARDVWDANRDGIVDAGAPTAAGIKLCVIDSGIYTAHEDLQGVTASGYGSGSLAWNKDGSGHGTHVSGTIVAMNNALGVVGVTPGTVSVYMVRVFGDDGNWAYASTLLDAAYKCRDAGAKIISMSLGGSISNNTEKNGFASLYGTYGILSIAAAGNDGTNRNSYPASYDSVISVAAIDSSKVVADFSQYNSQVELAAPGVGVLSTVPYLDASSVTVGGVTYPAGHIEYSARGAASGTLVSGGLCDSVGAWSGKVVLCERGVISFYDKVHNVQLGGGAAALIYNNVPGGFLGTLGEGNTATIIGLSLSQEDGQVLAASQLGSTASVSSTYSAPASGYEYYDGTSMATPHVSAVAALVWSSQPTATNVEIRTVLQQTAQDLGAAGRDVYYGFGLVQAKAAVDALGGGGGEQTMKVTNLSAVTTTVRNGWKATVTITVLNASGAAVPGARVDGRFSTSTKTVSCTTGTSGQCSVSVSLKNTVSSVTYTVTNVTAAGYVYDPSGVTAITITR